MIVERLDGRREVFENLSETEVLEQTTRAMRDTDVKRIQILPNRHERRKQAAIARREAKRASK